MSEDKVVVESLTSIDELNEDEKVTLRFWNDVNVANEKCELIRDEYTKFSTQNNQSLNDELNIVNDEIVKLETKLKQELTTLDEKIRIFNQQIESRIREIDVKKEEVINELTSQYKVNIERTNDLLTENDKQYHQKIDELNNLRDKNEDDNIDARNNLKNDIYDELLPLKENAAEEIKKIELTIQQTREDSSVALATLKRKFDADVRQIYKKNAAINDSYNNEAALVKKSYNDEIAKIEEKEEIRRQQLLLQVDALKIQYEDEKSKLLKKSVEAIASGDKKEAKELKIKTQNFEKFFQANLLSEQKDAEVDFKAIEEQRKIASFNLENKLKELKNKQLLALEENAHALRVLQNRYESEVQKRNLSREIVENELQERLYKQENANKLLLSSVNIQGDIKDRQLVYELNLSTLDFNKANNENYIDYQCFKVNQEYKQTSLQVNYDLDLKHAHLIHRKDILTVNKAKDSELLKFEALRKNIYLDYYYASFILDQKRLECEFSHSKKIKLKANQSKNERVKATYIPYLNRLDNEFNNLVVKYEKLIEIENSEYNETIKQIELSHEKELKYLKAKLEQVVSYKISNPNEIKTQLDNVIMACNNRYKIISEEVLKNHTKIIKGYESKISEAKNKLEIDKNRILDSMIYPIISDVVNYNQQLVDSEYSSAITSYNSLIDAMKNKFETEKSEIQRAVLNATNNINFEFNKNIELLETDYRNFKTQSDSKLKDEESVKFARLNEIEKNRQNALLDYQIAKQNSQKQYENDIINFEAKLSSLEQDIDKNNSLKAQSIMKVNSELMKSITIIENNLEKQINTSKAILEKNIKTYH